MNKDIAIIVGDGIEVDLNSINNLTSDKIEKIRELVEQDILFSQLDEITNIKVIEKGQETNSFYEGEQTDGISFFHKVGEIEIHVRLS
jgi:hypothetical protein